MDYLAWMTYDGYDRHTFFYFDDDPDEKELQQYLVWSPTREEMPKLKAYFASTYGIYEQIQDVAVFELPDLYVPGSEPRALVGYYHNPHDEQFNVGINASPPQQEPEILEYADKMVPAKNLETLVKNVMRTVGSDVEHEVERHVLEGDVQAFLDRDDGFQKQTVKEISGDIHPRYEGEEGEPWQKPASKVEYVEGAAGFVQIWVPVDEENIGLLALTSGEYDRQDVLEATQARLSNEL